jgi:hypothetical protein
MITPDKPTIPPHAAQATDYAASGDGPAWGRRSDGLQVLARRNDAPFETAARRYRRAGSIASGRSGIRLGERQMVFRQSISPMSKPIAQENHRRIPDAISSRI